MSPVVLDAEFIRERFERYRTMREAAPAQPALMPDGLPGVDRHPVRPHRSAPPARTG